MERAKMNGWTVVGVGDDGEDAWPRKHGVHDRRLFHLWNGVPTGMEMTVARVVQRSNVFVVV